ncbi:MAG: hypothetical protein AAB834_05310 [Patescibacteria group bacterium]
MDNANLKKKLSVYVSDKGYLRNVSDELLYEVLTSWKNWEGSSAEFYRTLGFTGSQIGPLLGKAKKFKRLGHFGDMGFKAITVEDVWLKASLNPYSRYFSILISKKSLLFA